MHFARRKRPEPSAFAPAVGVKSPQQSSQPSTTVKPASSTTSSTSTTTASPITSDPFKKGLVHFLAGGLSAGLVRASLQPLDTCKTRLQAARAVSTGTSHNLRRVLLAGGGIRGLYRGVIPGVIGIVPAAAVYMLTFQALKARLTRRLPRARNVAIALAAGLGDVAASLVRVPCEVLKQRLQVGVYTDLAHALGHVSTRASPLRLYTGLSAQLARDVPYAAVEFVFYENLKAYVLRVRGRDADRDGHVQSLQLQQTRLSRWQSFAVGGASGAAAAVVSNPMDVVKTRLMTQVRVAGAPVRYRGVAHALLTVAREEGVGTFAKGIAPRIAAKTLQSAMFFAAYEALKKSFAQVLNVDMSRKTAH